MNNYLTYEELMSLALEHYNEGGDSTYECVDEKMFNESYAKMTKADALRMFRLDYSMQKEMEGWC